MSGNRRQQPVLLALSVKSENWRMEDPWSSESDQEFRNVRKKALERDGNTCRACGFKAMRWMEVHHLDDNHANNALDNLATLCPFCHMVQHIGFAGQNGEARLVWLPEVGQAELHHIVRAILVAEHEARRADGRQTFVKSMAEAAGTLRARLIAREAGAKERIGTSDPAVLGDILMRFARISGDNLYARREGLLRGIRLLPLGVRRDRSTGENIVETRMILDWCGAGGGLKGGGEYAPFAGRGTKEWPNLLASAIPSTESP